MLGGLFDLIAFLGILGLFDCRHEQTKFLLGPVHADAFVALTSHRGDDVQYLRKSALERRSDSAQDKGDAMCMVHADAWRARPKFENAGAEVRSLAAVAIAANAPFTGKPNVYH